MSSIKRNVARAPEIFELKMAKRLDKSGFVVPFKPAANFAE